jgi:hypothetical protein
LSANRQLLLFFAIAFAYTWVTGAIMIYARLPLEYSILVSLGPTLAAVIVHRAAGGRGWPWRWSVSWRRTLVAAAVGGAGC